MKLRTQLLLSATLAIVAGLAAGAAVWLAAVKGDAAEALQQRAQAAAHETAGLLVLTQEVALRFEERAEQQWQQRHRALVALLGEGSGEESPAATVDSLRATNAVLAGVFARLVQLRDAPDSALAQQRKEFLVDRMLAETQSLADGVYRWSREARAVQQQAERRVHVIGVAALATLFLLVLAQVVLVWRRTAALEREMARRLASEERIAASETRLRDITNNIPALIGYFDA